MISTPHRQTATLLIEEAVTAGAHEIAIVVRPGSG